jgi:hypothetical protein
LADTSVLFRDDFDRVPQGSDWINSDAGDTFSSEDGVLTVRGRGVWENTLARTGLRAGDGVLLEFQHSRAAYEIFLANSDNADSDSYLRWGIGHYVQSMTMSCYGTSACRSAPDFTLENDTWYYLLLRAAPDDSYHIQIWPRDVPGGYVFDFSAPIPNAAWRNVEWRFSIQVRNGQMRFSRYEELRFAPAFVMPPVPPGTDLAALPTAVPERPTRVPAVPTATPDASAELTMIYGPVSGDLPHDPGNDTVEWLFVDMNHRDVVLEAEFVAPYNGTNSRPWDAGFVVRATAGGNLRFIIRSDSTWACEVYDTEDFTTLDSGSITNLNTGFNDRNLIRASAIGDQGEIVVNGRLAGRCDLSTWMTRGSVAVATGLYTDAELRGAVTSYEDFTVYRAQ